MCHKRTHRIIGGVWTHLKGKDQHHRCIYPTLSLMWTQLNVCSIWNNWELANMKLIERLVWSRCNNVASGDEWFKAQRTRKDSLCLSRSQTRLTFRPQDLFPWSLTLIMWDLLILKFMNSQSNCLICFISRVLDFCPGNALFQLRNIWGCLALPWQTSSSLPPSHPIHTSIHQLVDPLYVGPISTFYLFFTGVFSTQGALIGQESK